MKIADIQNYRLPEQRNKNYRKKKTKIPMIRQMVQFSVDVLMSNIIRVITIYLAMKYFTRDIPMSEIAMAKEGDMDVFRHLFTKYNIGLYLVYMIFFSIITGSIYYIMMITFCKHGTLGTWIAKLKFYNKKSQTPNLWEAFLWYYLKIIYPVCGFVAIMLFISSGFTFMFFVFIALSMLFSNSLSIVFGITPLYEKLSSVYIDLISN